MQADTSADIAIEITLAFFGGDEEKAQELLRKALDPPAIDLDAGSGASRWRSRRKLEQQIAVKGALREFQRD